MRKNKIWKILAIFFIIFLLQFLFFWLRGGYITVLGLTGIPLSMIVFFVAYFIAAAWLIKKYRATLPLWVIITTILVGSSSMDLFFLLFTRHNYLLIPDLWLRIFGVLTGIGYSVVIGKRYKIAIAVLSCIFALCCSYFGLPLLLHKQNFGTFTGRIEQVIDTPVIFQDTDSKDIALADFRGKYVILNFWSTTCRDCIKEFPDVQALYEKLGQHDGAVFYGVFCRISTKNQTTHTGADILAERGYTFPTLSMAYEDSLREQLGVQFFPTVLIFDSAGTIVFRGNLKSAKRFMRTVK